jgi:aspartate kinase
VFDQVAAAGIFVDMIVQSYGKRDGQATLSFTVARSELEKSLKVTSQLSRSLSCHGVASNAQVAKLSVSGIGLRSHTGVAIRMFRSLADANINVEMINTSEVQVNVVVDGDTGEVALAQLQAAFADALH